MTRDDFVAAVIVELVAVRCGARLGQPRLRPLTREELQQARLDAERAYDDATPEPDMVAGAKMVWADVPRDGGAK